jgi:hypothetical protein
LLRVNRYLGNLPPMPGVFPPSRVIFLHLVSLIMLHQRA